MSRINLKSIVLTVAFMLVVASCSDSGGNPNVTSTSVPLTTTSEVATTTTTTTTIPPTTTTTTEAPVVMENLSVVIELSLAFESEESVCWSVPDDFRDVTFITEGAEVLIGSVQTDKIIGTGTLSLGSLEENDQGLTVCRFTASVEFPAQEAGYWYRLTADTLGQTVGVQEDSSSKSISTVFLHYPFTREDRPAGVEAGLGVKMVPPELYAQGIPLRAGQILTGTFIPNDDNIAVGFSSEVAGATFFAHANGYVAVSYEAATTTKGLRRSLAVAWETNRASEAVDMDIGYAIFTVRGSVNAPWSVGRTNISIEAGRVLMNFPFSLEEFTTLAVDEVFTFISFFDYVDVPGYPPQWGGTTEVLYRFFPYLQYVENPF